MIDTLLDAFTAIDRILWGPWTMLFIAGVAVYFTVRSRFFQVARFPYILRNTAGTLFSRQADSPAQRITPFQATATSLAGTVGMGTMAGVATALSVGGPGTIFWMWVLALLGMMSKTAEISLAVHYRDVEEDGRIHGGPMHYIRRGLGWKFLALLFSGGILINSLFSASLLQYKTNPKSTIQNQITLHSEAEAVSHSLRPPETCPIRENILRGRSRRRPGRVRSHR